MHKSSVKVKVWLMFYLEYSSQISILYFRMRTQIQSCKEPLGLRGYPLLEVIS